MNRTFIVFIFGVTFFVTFVRGVYAQNVFEPVIWKGEEEVTVRGQGLIGEVPEERLLCFAPEALPDDLKCFKPDSPSIKKWTQTTIVFVPAANTPPLGVLKVYVTNDEDVCTLVGGNRVCQQRKRQEEIELGPYRAHPTILTLVDRETGLSVGSLTVGKEYEVKGYRFGDEARELYVGIRRMDSKDIVSWSFSSIVFRPTEIPVDGMTELFVRSSAAKSNPYPVVISDPVSNDPYSHLQSHLPMHNVSSAWGIAEGAGITVAVIDSGVDTNTAEFAGRIWQNRREIRGNGVDDDRNGYVDDVNGWNFVRGAPELTPTSAHGTAVAGVIGAARNNGAGVAGVAPKVTIMPLTVSDAAGSIEGEYVGEAIRYAVDNGADIINLSMGGPGFTTDFDPAFTDFIRYAADRDVLVVIAAGNGDVIGQQVGNAQGVNLNQNPKSPVCNRESAQWSIGVAALNRSGDRARFSDYGGNCIDAAALGEHVVTNAFYALTEGNVEYVSVHGTSFAAPIVSGVAALVKSVNPALSAAQLRDVIVSTMERVNDATVPGSIDAYAAVQEAKKRKSNLPLGTTQEVPSLAPRSSAKLAEQSEVGFPDVPSDYPYFPAISWGRETGVLQGYPDGTFRPTRTVNRAEFLKIVLEADGFDVEEARLRSQELRRGFDFPDVLFEEWYAPYIYEARRLGIIEGYPDGSFRPERPVNFAEALKMAYLALRIETRETGGNWYERYLLHAQYNDVLFDSNADMSSFVSREDVVWIVWRLMNP